MAKVGAKRKVGGRSGTGGNDGAKKKTGLSKKWVDEEIESSSDEGEDAGSGEDEDDMDKDEEIHETAEQKRKRMAKMYLASMTGDDESDGQDSGGEGGADMDDSGLPRDVVGERLERERLASQGKLHQRVAASLSSMDPAAVTQSHLVGHEASVTCLALTTDGRTLFSGSKDNAVLKWDVETGTCSTIRPTWKALREEAYAAGKDQFRGSHEGEVLSISVSTDGRYMTCGGRDKTVHVYDTRTDSLVKSMTGHRQAITCSAFRRGTYSLYTGSEDRTVKVWDLNEMGYLETLFGHQDPVYSMDCWTKEMPISSSADKTLRAWKILHETHLIFRGHKSSIDNVTMLDDGRYVSGGQDGALCLWKDTQKKPVCTKQAAHGSDSSGLNARWVCSLAALKMTDVFASGSYDGMVRLWQADTDKRQLTEALALPVNGIVNALALSSELVVAGTGRDHKYGKWFQDKSCENNIVLMRLPQAMREAVGHHDVDAEAEGDNHDMDVTLEDDDDVGDYSDEEEDDDTEEDGVDTEEDEEE